MNNLIKIILIILVLNFLFKNNQMEKFGLSYSDKCETYIENKNKNCHASCKSCGYSDDPSGPNDCIECNPGYKHKKVYEDGTGSCTPDSKPDQASTTISQDEADKLNEKELNRRLSLHKIKNCSKDTDCLYGGCDKKKGKCYHLACQNHSDCSFDNGVQAGYCNKWDGESYGYCAYFDKNDCEITVGGDEHAKCRNKKGETNKCLRYWRGQWTTDYVYRYKCVSNKEYKDAESKRDSPCTTWGAMYQCGKNLQCKPDPTGSDAVNGTCN